MSTSSSAPKPSTAAKFYSWSTVPAEQLNPLLTRQFISGDQATLAHIHLKAGATVPTHAHHNEQISSVVTGALQFTLDPHGANEIIVVRAGEVLVMPAHLPHSALALEDTLNIDFFAPVRTDWVNGDDDYLRGSVPSE